jgi:GTP-dependent phosphoenolpyruvate carboxykinase
MALDRQAWLDELKLHGELFDRLEDRLPGELRSRRDALATRLQQAPARWTAA